MHQMAVGILMFDGVEVLDFAGPYEVFSRTRLTRVSSHDGPTSLRHIASSPSPRAPHP